MVLSKKVAIKTDGIHGNCWFASEKIKAGEMIWELGNIPYHDIDINKKELDSWPAEKREKFLSLAYMIEEGIWRGSDPNRVVPQSELDEYFVNHSCDGNSWYQGEDLLIASRDILPGEEISYDYCLTECDPSYILATKCLCGTKLCRGLVSGNDWKLENLQKKYGEHFTPHVLKLIAKQREQQKQ